MVYFCWASCKEYLSVTKFKTSLLLRIKHWTVWCIMCGSPFCVIIYRRYKILKMALLWLTRYEVGHLFRLIMMQVTNIPWPHIRAYTKKYRTPQRVDWWRFPTFMHIRNKWQKSQPQVNFWEFKHCSRAIPAIDRSLYYSVASRRPPGGKWACCSCSLEITSRNATSCPHAVYMSDHQQATRRVVWS